MPDLKCHQAVQFQAGDNEPEATGTISRVWVKPKADPYVTIRSNGRTFVRSSSAVRPLCGTVGCKRPAAEEISYIYRGSDERDTDLACTPCADGYERRTVLKSFTRRPLSAGTVQVLRRSWTASVSPASKWEDLRPATGDEMALLRTIPDGGSSFWLRPDGTSYYAPGARSNADQLVRIVRSS